MLRAIRRAAQLFPPDRHLFLLSHAARRGPRGPVGPAGRTVPALRKDKAARRGVVKEGGGGGKYRVTSAAGREDQ